MQAGPLARAHAEQGCGPGTPPPARLPFLCPRSRPRGYASRGVRRPAQRSAGHSSEALGIFPTVPTPPPPLLPGLRRPSRLARHPDATFSAPPWPPNSPVAVSAVRPRWPGPCYPALRSLGPRISSLQVAGRTHGHTQGPCWRRPEADAADRLVAPLHVRPADRLTPRPARGSGCCERRLESVSRVGVGRGRQGPPAPRRHRKQE